ncbi:uncharacterized protein LOC126657173 [Mercurialis annua]|uniref:uncharacterized protein LOC126657173 n=1 Tax=Mercurialis annua TaxID=3986 RepID=UPI0021605778|nr:uncharacterized protein LOC126657173 [Mercurialis annua]
MVDRFPNVNIKDSEVPKSTVVCKLWRRDRWRLPDPMDEVTQEAWDYVSNNYSISNYEDKVYWVPSKSGSFSVNSLWRNLNPSLPKVPWASLVWFSGSIPRHSFILWLCLKKRLLTKDKLMAWNVVSSDSCSLCGSHPENLEHLFFACGYSQNIWSNVLFILGLNRHSFSWNREVSFFIKRSAGKSLVSKIRKLWFSAAVYFIWKARNDAIFNQFLAPADQVFKNINFTVAARINNHTSLYFALVLGLGCVLAVAKILGGKWSKTEEIDPRVCTIRDTPISRSNRFKTTLVASKEA